MLSFIHETQSETSSAKSLSSAPPRLPPSAPMPLRSPLFPSGKGFGEPGTKKLLFPSACPSPTRHPSRPPDADFSTVWSHGWVEVTASVHAGAMFNAAPPENPVCPRSLGPT